MKDHSNCLKGFHRSSKAIYKDVVDELRITIGMYHEDGSTSGEFCIHWIDFGDRMVPRLDAYDDAWSALNEFKDLLEVLSKHDGEDISEQKLYDLLIELGIKDLTKYK